MTLAFSSALPLSSPTIRPRSRCRRIAVATVSEERPAAPPTPPQDPDATVDSYVTPPSLPTPSLQSLIPPPCTNREATILGAHQSTAAVHAGQRTRSSQSSSAILDAIQVPIVQSSTFTFKDTNECILYNQGKYKSFEYGRYGNPTTRAVEEKIMALEGADDCIVSSSGMNAVTTMLLALLPQNGHIVVTTDCYRRTRQFVNAFLPKMGVTYTVLDPSDVQSLQTVFETKDVTMYFSECPTNPLIRVVDVPTVVALCRKHNVISVIDTTFATPYNFKPIDFGTDLVLHSGTKYLSGHQDVMCGVLAGRADLIQSVRKLHGVLGGILDPNTAFLVNRGMKTLTQRMQAHNNNAEQLAKFLDNHPKISTVHFPTLESHVDYAVASRLFEKGFGGVLSFELKGDGNPWSQETFAATGRFVDNLQIPYIGPSLGGCESIVEQVCIMGYFDQPLKERRTIGYYKWACSIFMRY